MIGGIPVSVLVVIGALIAAIVAAPILERWVLRRIVVREARRLTRTAAPERTYDPPPHRVEIDDA